MTEEDARAWMVMHFGETATERVAWFLSEVGAENVRQNLISRASVASIWARHAVDSAQLLGFVPSNWTSWLDIGTGGGFPGMIVALLTRDRDVTMVEPRKRRASFLQQCINAAGLTQARVIVAKVEAVTETFDVISARAVAAPEVLLSSAHKCAHDKTVWLLPRGQTAKGSPGSMFHVEHSITDPTSAIFITTGRPT